ncbi:MAG: 5'-nucleotidase C-terminal domain-containing protein [Planctomycetes bacterium]|nr:5'-nucleotidase C-terminal domain-containing protein [Planctomycetota bacterium]
MRCWRLAILALLFGCLPLACGPVPEPASDQPVEVAVLFFNDIHGHLLPFNVKLPDGTRGEVGGIARLASLIRGIASDNHRRGGKTVTLIAGDILQGTPMSTVFKGKPDVEIFNAIAVDAMTVGNHEFDFGLDNFLELKKLARFPFLSANVVWKESGEPLCDGAVSIPLAPDLHLTVIGVTTTELLTTTKPSNVERIAVKDPVPIVKDLYGKHGPKGPVILLSHSKADTDEEIARAVPGLTAIIGGHDQILLNPRKLVGPVPVFQAFEKGRFLGVLRLLVARSAKTALLTDWVYLPVTPDLTEDPEVAERVESYRARLDSQFKEVVGTCETYLDGERGRIRYEETNLGNFVTDIMREYTNAEIALLNAGSLRASLDEGPITLEAIFNVMPYENELCRVEVTGEELLRILARGMSGSREDEDGGFLHVSGLTLRVRDGKVRDVLVGGAGVDPARTYTVAITDFMASGGDGYDILKAKPAVKTGSPLRDLIVDTIRSRKTVSAKTEGRIVRD